MYIMTRDKECKYGLLTAWSLSGYEVYEVTFQRKILKCLKQQNAHIQYILYPTCYLFCGSIKKIPILYYIFYFVCLKHSYKHSYLHSG